MSFLDELKRRNVFRAAIAYIVLAWLVLQVADVVLPNLDAPGWVFKVILVGLVVGLPVVLVVAWVFELTSAGFKRESEVEHSGTTIRSYGRQLDYAIIAMLVVALGYFVYDKFVLSQADADKSIAVLPLKNWTGDPDQEYFADGLSEELLNLLNRIPALRVIARTSSFSYKGKDKKISDIARELDVDHVLEGSVRGYSDTEVRISVQLIRANDESSIWSETYSRQLNNIFAIQDEIAKSVVDELKVQFLGDIPKVEQADPKAYSLYLQARELSPQSNAPDPGRSIELYLQALDIEPRYASAWSGLSENFIYLAEKARIETIRKVLEGQRCSTPEAVRTSEDASDLIDDAFREARCAASRALAIDPAHALALASLGRIAMVHDGNFAVAARHLERAMELDPADAHIIRQAAILSGNLQRPDEAVALLEFAVARDPVSPAVHNNLALNYYYSRDWDKAISAYRTALSLNTNPVGYHSWIGIAQVLDGDPEAGLAAIENERHAEVDRDRLERRPWRLIGEAVAYHALHRPEQSDESLAQLIDDYGDEWGSSVAYVLAFRGEVDRAFEWLQKAKDQNDSGLSEIAAEPAFDNLRSDPRWLPFLESIGKAPAQLAAIEFRVALPQ